LPKYLVEEKSITVLREPEMCSAAGQHDAKSSTRSPQEDAPVQIIRTVTEVRTSAKVDQTTIALKVQTFEYME
jgi:hypothetical protein